MSHTLAAVFDNRHDAERARDAVLAGGFRDQEVKLSASDSGTGSGAGIGSAQPASSTEAGRDDTSIGSSIKHFFSNLFGDDDEDTHTYTEAVNRGHQVLTVQGETLQDVERAADIIEGYGPLDIDERKSEWTAAGWTGAQLAGATAATATGTAGQYMGAQQSAQGGTLQGQAGGASQQRAESSEQTIPVIQEELRVGKRVVQRGGVRIYQRMVETPVTEIVNLREEHVVVERRPVDQPADPADLAAFQETSFELRESAEEAVVQKTARVVEEVVVGKEVSQHTDQVSDTVRSTEVEVEQLATGDLDDDYYRSHWTSNYAAAGGSYDDYAPAYRYGSSMAGADSYRGRSWDEAEPELRRSWESQYPQSAWDKFKAAVRHGWERLTS
jgi:uncharacterized protein (TIGR02271 family)